MATTTKNKQGTDVVESAEKVVVDLQAEGRARFDGIRTAVAAEVTKIDESLTNIVALVLPIRDESLWVYGANAEGESYNSWKEAVKDLLGGAFSHWSKQAKSGIVLQLIDAGFTVPEAAEITDSTTSEAKAVVKEADAEAQGTDAQAPTPPAEVSKEEKAKKVADQVIAQNKRGADVIFDMDLKTLEAVEISLRGFHTSVVEMIKHRVADEAGKATDAA
jgi:precorrin-2 methylase